ncbi:Uncharacterised protein [Lederbergia lenta]|uniref:Uncharacterized protein n=1 Tax=Lederbergia lenta TaxID=1467 RepID=A0A2X4WFH8_LEDLE|nr:Uncharacterised protein [Lederbergia lenta]
MTAESSPLLIAKGFYIFLDYGMTYVLIVIFDSKR